LFFGESVFSNEADLNVTLIIARYARSLAHHWSSELNLTSDPYDKMVAAIVPATAFWRGARVELSDRFQGNRNSVRRVAAVHRDSVWDHSNPGGHSVNPRGFGVGAGVGVGGIGGVVAVAS